MKTFFVLLVLLCSLLVWHRADAGNIIVTSNTTVGRIFQADGSTRLPSGSVVRVGHFDDADLAFISTSNDFAAIDSLFTPLGEGGTSGTLLPENGQSMNGPVIVNDDPAQGDFSAQIVQNNVGYLASGLQAYWWVFNSATPATATQWGIYASSAITWVTPDPTNSFQFLAQNPGDLTSLGGTVFRGSFGGGSDLVLAEIIPEPTRAMFLGIGFGYLAWRRRRS
ncbi:MAG: hypothetical protein AAF591_20280 [Verrucomicrobiota bacterium]